MTDKGIMFHVFVLALLLAITAASPQGTSDGLNTITSAATQPTPTYPVIGITIPRGATEISDPLLARIVGVTSFITTAVVQCAEDVGTNGCDFYPPNSIIAGTATYSRLNSLPQYTITLAENCTFTSTATGACRFSYVGWFDGSPSPSPGAPTTDLPLPTGIYTVAITSGDFIVYPVTVTAGPTTSLTFINATRKVTVTAGGTTSLTFVSDNDTDTDTDTGPTPTTSSSPSSSTNHDSITTTSATITNPSTMATTGSQSGAAVTSTSAPGRANNLIPTNIAGALAGMALLLI